MESENEWSEKRMKMRKTKIICTLGPASENEQVIRELMLAGMNVARLNFSHGSHEEQKRKADLVKKVRKELDLPVALLLDTKGPEIRTGMLENGKIELKKGQSFVLTTEDILGNEGMVSISYKDLVKDVKPGDSILIDDGLIGMKVNKVTDKEIFCVVENGGMISNKKGINVPGVNLSMPFISQKDYDDILFGIEEGFDYIAASFTRTADDILEIRKILEDKGCQSIKIIAKIENLQGVENIDEILRVSDGIMIARGDMGVEIPFERLPGIQKHFIRSCCQAGKTVITATQMLDSMEENRRPTRAEISDVANAVFDGSSAVMLSGETAAGKYPVDAVKTMARIAEQAEQDAFAADIYKNIWHAMDHSDNTNAVSAAACTMAEQTYAQAIIADTSTGKAARRVAKYRPAQMILAATPSEKVYHQLALVWGVYPLRTQPVDSVDVLFHCAIEKAKELGYLHSGDTVVMTAGIPLNTHGSTNMVKVQTIR